MDARLELGATTQSAQVEAAGALVQSEISSLGRVIDRERILELPLNGGNLCSQTARGDLAVHISGGRGDANSFLLDLVETRSSWFNSPRVLLSIELIIGEFRRPGD